MDSADAPVPATGWHVEIQTPGSGRIRVPDVINLQNAPVFNPGPNAQPTVRIPVRKNTTWASDTFDEDPVMRVWRNGRRLPIEVLRNVEQLEGATILVGIGGVELEQRVREEYDDDRRHTAADNLVTNNTSYIADAPEPDVQTRTDVIQQDPDTSLEFAGVLPSGDDQKYLLNNGEVSGRRVAWTREGELYDRGNEFRSTDPSNLSDYSAGDAAYLSRDSAATGGPDFAEFDFSVNTTIPASEFGFQFRVDDDPNNGLPGYIIELQHDDGSTYVLDENVGEGFTVQGPAWLDTELFDGEPYNGPDLTPGDYTVRIEVTDSNAGGDEFYLYLDAVAPYDKRAEGELTFSNSNGGDSSALEGPGWYVPQTVVFDNAPSAFSVTGGSASVNIDDTSGAQRVQISNDGGNTWVPDDGTEQNTTSVDVDYPTPGSGSRIRITVDGYEPSGTRSNIPARNYESQAIDAYTLRADLTQELLLIEEIFDNDIGSILTAIGEPAERSWGLQTNGSGDIVVRFVQNGQFNATYAPEFSDRTREKLGKTYDSVTVKGSNEPESNIPYTASTTFESLPRDNILSGSESVYDNTQNYDRGDDYEINYQAGEIRATSGGDLVVGDSYRIDFRYQARGTFTPPDAPADPDELVTTVPGVTNTRLAEQVAFVLVTETDTPRYAAEVTIPDPDIRFDPTDALPPGELGLPSNIESLEVRGEPQLTEDGLAVRFGTRPPIEATQRRISRQLGRVSDRS